MFNSYNFFKIYLIEIAEVLPKENLDFRMSVKTNYIHYLRQHIPNNYFQYKI